MNAVIVKTHLWNADIEQFAFKIWNETIRNNVHFYILMHSNDNQLIKTVQNKQLITHIIQFNESQIKAIYDTGFYDMWLSNHWILMWFYRHHSHYQYIWSVEYDVRITGDASRLWTDNSTTDFLYVRGNYHLPNAPYSHYYTGNKLTESDKYYGFLQLARYSKRCLDCLNSSYVAGENGQDELITYSLIRWHQLSVNDQLLKKYIGGHWTGNNAFSLENKQIWRWFCKRYPSRLLIFHPIK